MEKLKARMLAQMRPASLVDPGASWQQRKSGEMRIRILDATIDCLVEKGYAALSTTDVTKRAGVSRGAMHHHFQSRQALVAEVTEYIFYQRMDQFLADYSQALDTRGEASDVEAAADSYWRTVQTPQYAAYLQLAVAAQTDRELNSHFLPASRRFDQIWTAEMIRSFPQWEAHWSALQLANDFAIVVHMGLLIHQPIFGEGARTRAILDIVTETIKQLKKAV